MSVDYSLASLNPIGPVDLTAGLKGADDATRIKQVSKAMEALFINQLTAELGKGIDGSDDESTKPYGDFIQQAFTEGVSQGGGLGLAKIIEGTLTHGKSAVPVHLDLKPNNTSYHVNHTD